MKLTEAKMICKPLLTQIKPTYFSVDCGMAYLIRLESGKFILIDSTYGEYDEVDHIYSLMCEQNVTDSLPCVAAWFFTHPHDDHTNGFIRMACEYKEKLIVEKVICNFPADLCEITHNHKGFLAAIDTFGASVITPHKGDVLRFDGAEFKVIFASEDCTVRPVNVNETSLTMKMTLGQYSVMWLGDLQPIGSKIVTEGYKSEELRCNILQVGHHGYWGGSDELYRAVDPEIALWPVPEFRYIDMLADPHNRFFTDKGTRLRHIFYSGIEEITLDMSAPIETTIPYVKAKKAVDLSQKSVYALNWSCITGGNMGYGFADLSFGDNCCTLTAKDRPTLIKMVQKGQAATSEELNFEIELIPETDCEILGLICDCPHPTDPEAYKFHPIPHNAGEKLDIALKIDRSAAKALIRINGSNGELPLTANEPCDVILILKNARVTVTRAEFENV